MQITRYATFFIFVLLGFLIYSNVLHGPFILDDEGYIADNYRIRDMANFLKDFSGTRYIGFLSFALNYYFGGLYTFGYHLVNIIIHTINAFLVYLLIQITVNNLKSNAHSLSPIAYIDYLPFISSLIFLVHPIQTQAVSYITQRFTSLATLFYLLAIVLYIKARCYGLEHRHSQGSPIAYHPLPIAFYVLSVISAILAMKTKEISFTLPFLVLLYEITFFSNDVSRIISRFLCLLPFLLTLLIIPLTFRWTQETGDITPAQDIGERIMKLQLTEMKDLSRYTYLLTQFRVIITYMRLLILPINQTFEYDYPLSKSLFEPATFISGLFLLSTLVSTIYLYAQSLKKDNEVKKLISFGILWFFITLSVESSIIPIKDVIFEHRLYVPSVGFILSATTSLFYGFGYLEKRINRPLWNYLLAIIIIAAVILSFTAYKRNILWGNSHLMWLDNINKAPTRAMPHNNLGNIYLNQGRIDEAIKEYMAALRLEPDYVNAHNNLGAAYFNQGRIDEAIKEFLTALRLKPDYADAHYNLGAAYFNQGWIDEAIKEFLIAIKFKPDYVSAHNNLGAAYFNQGRIDEAIKEYLIAIKFKPDHANAHNNLGIAYKIKGLKYEAKKEFETALKLNPYDADARQAIEWLEK